MRIYREVKKLDKFSKVFVKKVNNIELEFMEEMNIWVHGIMVCLMMILLMML